MTNGIRSLITKGAVAAGLATLATVATGDGLVGQVADAGIELQGEPSEYFVYVAAESADEVALVRFGPDGAAVEEEIPVGFFPREIEGPHGIAVHPGGARWYVSIAHGLPFGQVLAYSTATNELLGRVEVGLFPATMAVSEAGLLFVTNFNLHGDPVPSSVSVVDTESMAELVRIPTCAQPHGSRLTADGKRHYSVCVRDEQLVEIDARALRVSRRMYLRPGGERPLPPETTEAADVVGDDAKTGARCGPTWAHPSPDGRFVYVACNKNGEVLEIDIDAWRVRRRFATGAGPYNLDVTPDGRLLVVTYKGGQATGLFDLSSGEERTVVPTARRLPHGIALSPDSRYAFISVEGVGGEPGTVEVIDLRSGTTVGRAEIGRQAGGIGFWKVESVRGRRAAG